MTTDKKSSKRKCDTIVLPLDQDNESPHHALEHFKSHTHLLWGCGCKINTKQFSFPIIGYLQQNRLIIYEFTIKNIDSNNEERLYEKYRFINNRDVNDLRPLKWKDSSWKTFIEMKNFIKKDKPFPIEEMELFTKKKPLTGTQNYARVKSNIKVKK